MNAKHDLEATGNTFDSIRSEAAITLLDKLTTCASKVEQVPEIEYYLEDLGSITIVIEHRDLAVGCSIGPDLGLCLRRKRLDTRGEIVPHAGSYENQIRRGICRLTKKDCRHICVWQTKPRGAM